MSRVIGKLYNIISLFKRKEQKEHIPVFCLCHFCGKSFDSREVVSEQPVDIYCSQSCLDKGVEYNRMTKFGDITIYGKLSPKVFIDDVVLVSDLIKRWKDG